MIQIFIAGTLLLAWIWVLGRPLMSSRAPTAYEEFLARNPGRVADATSTAPPSARPGSWRLLEDLQKWWRRPPHVWRRQLLMATMLATFVSFFLAVSLRNSLGNTFLYLFAMMALGLALHLGIAAYLGGRILKANRATIVSAAKAQVQPGSMSIRADQVGGPAPSGRRSILNDDDQVTLYGFDVDLDVDADIDDASGELSAESAFNLAADIASALEAGERQASIDQVAEVSGLIESEWGEEEPQFDAEPQFDVEPEPEIEPQYEIAPEASDVPYEPGEEANHSERIEETELADAADQIEPIFRRAAADEPTRPRRKPKPIYIESQLDDDPGDEPKAVNYP